MIKKLTKGKGLFRTVLFLPYVLGMLAMGYVWRFIFENVFSQTLFGTDGVVHVEVLNNMLQWKALLAYAIVGVWQVAGYYLIIYLNGLNNISEDIYEAARIDGATGWTSFRKITLPLLMPSFTIVLFMSLANSFKMLDLTDRGQFRNDHDILHDTENSKRELSSGIRRGAGTGSYILRYHCSYIYSSGNDH